MSEVTNRAGGAGPADRSLVALPKAHLHLHFTGSMRLATLLELGEAHGIRLPESLRTRDLPDLSPDQRGWFRFQRLYDAARSVVRDAADMRRIVAEAAEDDAAEGSRWLELQIDPTSYAPYVGGITPALEIVLDAAAAASSADFGVGVIVAASRIRHPFEARTLARLAAKYAGEGPGSVIGFGLSNDERRGVTSEFRPAFDIARQAGLALVPHGGELLGADHVREVLDSLHPDRIGHGVRVSDDPEVLAEAVARGVGLEVCPASNVSLGVFEHAGQVPLRSLMDSGVRIALGADDPLLFGSRLVDQYLIARHDLGFDDARLAALAASSLEISRAPAPLRERALAGVAAWLEDPAPPGPPGRR